MEYKPVESDQEQLASRIKETLFHEQVIPNEVIRKQLLATYEQLFKDPTKLNVYTQLSYRNTRPKNIVDNQGPTFLVRPLPIEFFTQTGSLSLTPGLLPLNPEDARSQLFVEIRTIQDSRTIDALDRYHEAGPDLLQNTKEYLHGTRVMEELEGIKNNLKVVGRTPTERHIVSLQTAWYDKRQRTRVNFTYGKLIIADRVNGTSDITLLGMGVDPLATIQIKD